MQVATQLVERRFQRYVDVLYSLDAFANHEPDSPRDQFSRFVSGLEVGRRLPGVQARSLEDA